MAEQARVTRVDPIGAMDQRWTAEAEAADLIVDMRHDIQGTWGQAGGYVRAIPLTMAALFPVHSIHWFAQHNGGRQWTILEAGSPVTLSFLDHASGSHNPIQTGRTLVEGPWIGTHYWDDGNWTYIINGYDEPVRWDGDRLVRIGFGVAPPRLLATFAPHDQLDADYTPVVPTYFRGTFGFQRGIGEVGVSDATPWLYGYAYTWINDRGHESPASPIVYVRQNNPEFVPGGPAGSQNKEGHKSVLLQIPASPANVSGIRVYRTSNVHGATTVGQQGAALYFHSEYSAAGKITIIDDTPDRELFFLFQPDSTGLFPGGARFAAKFKGTLFVDEGVNSPSRVRFSSPLLIEQMPSINYLIVGDTRSGPVTGMQSTRNALVVFKKRGIYLIKGDPRGGFFSETLTETVGCVAPRAIEEIPGVGLLFFAEDGPYVLLGALENTGTITEARFIGERIPLVWEREVNVKALDAARSVRYGRDQEVWVQLPGGGDDRNTLGLVFHYANPKGWSIRRAYNWSCMTATDDHRHLLIAGSWDTNHKGVWVYTQATDKDGDAVETELRSAWVNNGQRVITRNVNLRVVGYGRVQVFEFHKDRESIVWQPSHDAGRESTDLESERPIWGRDIWDLTKFWADHVPVTVKYDLDAVNAFDFQWRVTSARIGIIGYDTSYRPFVSNIERLNRTD